MFKKIVRNPKLLYAAALVLIVLTVNVVMPATGLKSIDDSFVVLGVDEMASVLGAGCTGTAYCNDCIQTRAFGCNTGYHNCQTGEDCDGFADCSDANRVRRTCYEQERECDGSTRGSGESVCIHAFASPNSYWEECYCIIGPGPNVCGQSWGSSGIRLTCFYSSCQTCPG